jgi:hypothetical protein
MGTMLFLRSWRCHSRRCRRWIRPADSPHRSCSRSDEHWTKRSARDRQPSARRSPLSRGASALPKRPGGMCVLSFAARQYTETNACIRALATLLRDARSSTLRPLRRCESCNTYAGKYASDISCDLSSVEDTRILGNGGNENRPTPLLTRIGPASGGSVRSIGTRCRREWRWPSKRRLRCGHS